MSRPSPSVSATKCHWETRTGNDGNLWQSKPNKNNVFSWRKLSIKKTTSKKSRKSKKKSIRKSSHKKISDNEFWRQIEMFKWQKDHDYKRISTEFGKLRPVFRKQLIQFIDNKITKLTDFYIDNDELSINDSSFSDLMAEVVGRGELCYESINIKKLKKMIDKNDFYESFYYSFL